MSAFHQSARWKALRLQAKRRDGFACVLCGSRLRLEVDHIAPRERRPDLAYSLENLRTLCRNCHIDKTRAETAENELKGRKEWRDAIESICRARAR